MSTTSIGEVVERYGEVPLASGAKYEVVALQTHKGRAASLRFISANGSQRELVIFAGGVAGVVELLELFERDARRTRDIKFAEAAQVRRASREERAEVLGAHPTLDPTTHSIARYWHALGYAHGAVDAKDGRITREDLVQARERYETARKEAEQLTSTPPRNQ